MATLTLPGILTMTGKKERITCWKRKQMPQTGCPLTQWSWQEEK